MLRRPLLSSKDHTRTTPHDLFTALNSRFNFTLDCAASDENAVCPSYITEEENAFRFNWGLEAGPGTCFCNPPYGHTVAKWVAKAVNESKLGADVVILLPARPDTKWFHRAWYDADEVMFVHGRLHFGNAGAAPFPSVLFTFGKPGGKFDYAYRRVFFVDTKGRML